MIRERKCELGVCVSELRLCDTCVLSALDQHNIPSGSPLHGLSVCIRKMRRERTSTHRVQVRFDGECVHGLDVYATLRNSMHDPMQQIRILIGQVMCRRVGSYSILTPAQSKDRLKTSSRVSPLRMIIRFPIPGARRSSIVPFSIPHGHSLVRHTGSTAPLRAQFHSLASAAPSDPHAAQMFHSSDTSRMRTFERRT